MEHVRGNYLPAAGSDWALPLYDPLVKLLGADKAHSPRPSRPPAQSQSVGYWLWHGYPSYFESGDFPSMRDVQLALVPHDVIDGPIKRVRHDSHGARLRDSPDSRRRGEITVGIAGLRNVHVPIFVESDARGIDQVAHDDLDAVSGCDPCTGWISRRDFWKLLGRNRLRDRLHVFAANWLGGGCGGRICCGRHRALCSTTSK
jgi:hypothetical protein